MAVDVGCCCLRMMFIACRCVLLFVVWCLLRVVLCLLFSGGWVLFCGVVCFLLCVG